MMLSDDERRELAAIERRFASEDPRLVRRLRRGFAESLRLNVLFAAVLLAGGTCGLLLIVAGVTAPSLALVITGSLIIGGGVAAAVLWFHRRRGRDAE